MDEFISWTIGETEVSSANSCAVDERLWLRSFMYIRKESGPIGGEEVTHWYLPLKKLSLSFEDVPEIPID